MEILTNTFFFGEEYHLAINEDNLYILLDEDEDELETYGKANPNDNKEDALRGLYLRYKKLWQYKSRNVTSEQFIEMLERVHHNGREEGRKHQIGLIIEDLEKMQGDF